MTWEKLQIFINEEYKRLKSSKLKKDKEILVRLVKINEEVGELCGVALNSMGLARKEKIKTFKKEQVEDELADVIFTTLLLAKSLDIDMKKALAEKIKIIVERFK